MTGRVFVALGVLLATLSFGAPAAEKAGKFRNFRVAIYVTRDNVIEWADPQKIALAYNDMCRQLKFDKVYLEIASGKLLVSEATIEPIKKFFTDHGVEVACAIVANGSSGFGGTSSQAGSLSFSVQADRDYLKSIAELAARHFDEVILDDWFFSAAKTSAEIDAKGNRSWTRYRLDTLDDAALNLLIKPAKAINPRMRLIIKFPNWYEHYQGLGYDLEVEPKLFDGIYTGVETRDPAFWDQHLQQYESYDLFRYLENVKPGGNGGGWVDTLLTRYIDRYPEQIWDLAFAKPKEITLWRWRDELASIEIGERPWQNQETSFNLAKMDASFAARTVAAESSQPAVARNGHVAEYAMEQVDSFLGELGNPIGIDAYRPPHATGEEFYHDFLGMVGVPIDLHFSFPDASTSSVILLTESAKSDPDIVKKIKAQLAAGKTVDHHLGLALCLNPLISSFLVTAL